MSEDPFRDRCGYAVPLELAQIPHRSRPAPVPSLYEDTDNWSKYMDRYRCHRETWRDHDHCIWHTDVADKPPDKLAAARVDDSEILDGAVLRDTRVRPSLAGCRLMKADLRNASFWRSDLSETNFVNANLTDASLKGVELSGAYFRDACLRSAKIVDADVTNGEENDIDVRGANMEQIAIDHELVERLKIDEGTKFGGRSQWEAALDAAAQSQIPLPWQPSWLRGLGRVLITDFPEDQNPLVDAQNQYRAIQRLLRERNFRENPELDVREKHARRKQGLQEGGPHRWKALLDPRQHTDEGGYPVFKTWLPLAGARWLTLYGESPWRVVYTSLAVIVSCGILYPLIGGIALTTPNTQLVIFEPLRTPLDEMSGGTWLASLYFSLVTFTTLGYGVQPASAPAQILAGIESLVGAALLALLVAVLARRITR